ncbi:MAG: 4-hydroxy-tetrahydrodipicolinate synthase [Endomicrobium sp.]|jgi:4-hydroxy-tetrahydrodipicolinate synthase|nr:4-hydroxy-tetrahydrodipicolinate synthase [Endomicrobium sp.]
MFSGVYTALITPFKNEKIDFDSLKKIIECQIKNGVDGIVPCGTTGEASTLSREEHEEIIKFCVKNASKKIKILAGTGSNSTNEAIHFTKFAEKIGCDGALIISPYYNKPTQKGLYLHFKTIADIVDIPIVIYNIADRTSINIEPTTIAELFNDCRNIVGVKEASGSLNQMSAIKSLAPGIELISGDDMLTLPLLSICGSGVVSVLSNIVPAKIVSLVRTFKNGEIKAAMKLHYKLFPLAKSMFIETSPIPIKTAASLLGICELSLRLPMCEMEIINKIKLEKALKDFGVLS